MSNESQNPKDIAARNRVPLELLPAIGRIWGAMGCKDGAVKYGPYNWREKAISLMGYTGAMERHLLAIRDGEDLAQDSLCEHLGHIIATASILLDARECDMLIDDRPRPGPAPRLLEELKGDIHRGDCPMTFNRAPGHPTVQCEREKGHSDDCLFPSSDKS